MQAFVDGIQKSTPVKDDKPTRNPAQKQAA
jgi:hypothetical protein